MGLAGRDGEQCQGWSPSPTGRRQPCNGHGSGTTLYRLVLTRVSPSEHSWGGGCAAPQPARRGLVALPKSSGSRKRWVVPAVLLLVYPPPECCWWLRQAVTGSAKHSMCCPPAGFAPLMSREQEGQRVSPSCRRHTATPHAPGRVAGNHQQGWGGCSQGWRVAGGNLLNTCHEMQWFL